MVCLGGDHSLARCTQGLRLTRRAPDYPFWCTWAVPSFPVAMLMNDSGELVQRENNARAVLFGVAPDMSQ